MKKIKNMVVKIDDELNDAQNYAELYIEYKAKGNSDASKYKQMAAQELEHSMILHDIATKEIDELSKVFNPPSEMEDAWIESHKEYVSKRALIESILKM